DWHPLHPLLARSSLSRYRPSSLRRTKRRTTTNEAAKGRRTKQRKLLFLSRRHRHGDDIPGLYLTRRETVEIDKGVSSTANGESKGQYWLDSGDDTYKDKEVLRYFLAQVEAGSLLSITVAFSWQKAARVGPRFM
ncbi:hypothetical protein Dimus_029308, partial [Dionaea muscipula]